MSVSLPMETPDGTSAIHVGTLEVRAEDPNECGKPHPRHKAHICF